MTTGVFPDEGLSVIQMSKISHWNGWQPPSLDEGTVGNDRVCIRFRSVLAVRRQRASFVPKLPGCQELLVAETDTAGYRFEAENENCAVAVELHQK